MPRCSECGEVLSPRTVWSGFTLTNRERGHIVCPECGSELEVTPVSGALQVALLVLAGLTMSAVAWLMARHETPTPLVVLTVVVVLGSECLVGYLLLSRFRARSRLSLSPARGSDKYKHKDL